MGSKDKDLKNKFFSILREVTKKILPMSKDGKSVRPFDIIQNIEEFLHK